MDHGGLAGGNGDAATCGGELAYAALDEVCEASDVRQGRADPHGGLVDADITDIDQDGFATKRAVALKWRVGELRTAEVDLNDILGYGNCDIDGACDVHNRVFIEINLSGGLDESGGWRDTALEKPFTCGDADKGVRGEEGGVLAKVDGESLHVDLRSQGELGADDGFSASVFRKNLYGGGFAESDGAGAAVEEGDDAGA